MKTIQVQPWSADQGDFVVINEEDFDESVHKRYDESAKKGRKPAAQPQEPASKE